MAITITVQNESDLQEWLAEHRAVNHDLAFTAGTGGAGYEIEITGSSSVGSFNPHIIHSSLGAYVGGGSTITDLSIPTDTKTINLSVLIDQSQSIADEHENVIYTYTPSGGGESPAVAGTAAIAFADNFDATGGYDRNSLTFGPAIVYVDKKNVGLTTEEGLVLTRMYEANEVLSGSVLGSIGKVPVKEGYTVKFSMGQISLANLKWQWALKNTPARHSDIAILGTTYTAGERIDLIPEDPGFAPEHHVLIRVPHRKDGKIFVVELFAATIANPGDLSFVKDPHAAVNVELTGHSVPDPDNAIAGYVYLLDKV